MVTELKRLEPNAKSFEANGKKYIVHDSLVESAYQEMENLMLEMGTGSSAGQLVKAMGNAVNALNQSKLYDASVILYNATSTAERLNQNIPHPMLRIFTLFVRPQGSDVREWNEAEAIEWLKDFNEEGYAMDDLFNAAAIYSKDFIHGLYPSSPTISE